MCLGWAWGIAAIAAANSVRDQARLQQQIQEVQASYAIPSADHIYFQNAEIYPGLSMEFL